jgi:hypothetical protein
VGAGQLRLLAYTENAIYLSMVNENSEQKITGSAQKRMKQGKSFLVLKLEKRVTLWVLHCTVLKNKLYYHSVQCFKLEKK